jgi:hypothetical protein
METFVKIFRARRAEVACDEANIYAENEGLEIVGSALHIYLEGKPGEEACLTVSFKKIRKRSAKGGEKE